MSTQGAEAPAGGSSPELSQDEARVVGERVLGRQISPDAKRHHFTTPPPIYLLEPGIDTLPANAEGEQ